MDVASIGNVLVALALSVPRMLACIVMAPVFPSSVTPRMIRVAMSGGFALPAMVGVIPALDQTGTPLALVALLLKETAIGIMLGFVLAAPFWAIEGVGALFDQQRGATFAQTITPFSQQDQSPLASVLRMSLTVFLITTGGIGLMYDLMLRSFEVWPILSLTPSSSFFSADQFIAAFSGMTEQALLYAAPVLAVIILMDFVFGLLGIFAPQLPVFFAAMPVKSIVGMFVLCVYVGILVHNAGDYFANQAGIHTSMMLQHKR